MKKICFVLAILLIAGCTAADQPVKLEDGSRGYHVFCSGVPYSDNDDCLSRARDMCGDGGYTVVREGQPPYPHSEMLWDNTTRDILVRCNNP